MSVNWAEPASAADQGEPLEVVLLKSGRTKIRYPAGPVGDDGTRITVRAAWAGNGVRDFGAFRFEPGDLFTEHYWRDRWYAVKEVRAADGALKGWYCDVTRPARVVPGEIRVEDLDLDLWCSADRGTVIRLDEDEFAASGLPGRDPGAAAEAVRALDELEGLARGPGLASLVG